MNVLGALPPAGHGIYGRDLDPEYLKRFDFVALPFTASRVPAVASELRAAGVKVWLTQGPGHWTPAAFTGTVPAIVARCKQVGAVGFIADPENGWKDVPVGQRNALAERLGTMLKDASAELRVGLSSFPLFPAREKMAAACRGSVWGNIQLYAKGRPRASIEGWFAEWERLFGADRVIPAVSLSNHLDNSDPAIRTAQGFTNYLEMIPDSPGAMGWPTATPPQYMTDAYFAWSPGGLIAGPMSRLLGFIKTPIGVVAALGFILALAWLAVS